MANRPSGLSVTSVLLNSGEYKALIQDAAIGTQIDTIDTRGVADRYAYNQPVKAANSFEFVATMLRPSSGNDKQTGTDISLWSMGGTDFLADVESGSLSITVPTADAEGIAVFDKVPNVVGGQTIELTVKKMIVAGGSATFATLGFTGTNLSVAVQITTSGVSITFPGVLSAAKHSFNRGALQMEDVTIKLLGTPTAPASTTGLVGQCLLGDSTCPLKAITGANTYEADSSSTGTAATNCLITRLNVEFARGQETKISGTLAILGSPLVTAP